MQPQEEQPTFPHDQLDDTQGQQPPDEQPGSDSNEAVEAIQQEVQSARRPRYQVLRQARVLLPIYILLLALFATLAVWVHSHPILAIDVTITRDFQADRSPWLSTLMTAVSYLGNTALVFAALVWLTAGIFWMLRLRLEALIIRCGKETPGL